GRLRSDLPHAANRVQVEVLRDDSGDAELAVLLGLVVRPANRIARTRAERFPRFVGHLAVVHLDDRPKHGGSIVTPHGPSDGAQGRSADAGRYRIRGVGGAIRLTLAAACDDEDRAERKGWVDREG